MTSFEIRKSSLVRAIRAARAASDMAWISAKESGVVISNSNMENTVAATVKMVNLDNYKYDKNGVQHVISLDDVSTALEDLKQSNLMITIGNEALHLGSIIIPYSENRAIPIPSDIDSIRSEFNKTVLFPVSVLLTSVSNTISMWGEDKKSRIMGILSDNGILSMKYSMDWSDVNSTSMLKTIELDKSNDNIELYFDAAFLLKAAKSLPNKSKISMHWYADQLGEFVVNLDKNCSAFIDIGQITFAEE